MVALLIADPSPASCTTMPIRLAEYSTYREKLRPYSSVGNTLLTRITFIWDKFEHILVMVIDI